MCIFVTVFIDYGPEWEEAWNNYIKEWSPPAGSDDFVSATMLQKDLYKPLRTATEQRDEPYPDHFVFYCHYGYEPGTSEGPWMWMDEYEYLTTAPCKLISREAEVVDADGNGEYYYTVVMLDEDQLEDGMISTMEHNIPAGENHILTNVPRWAIGVKDKLYKKDEFLEKSFRHEMLMPDEIFPESWKNLQ